MSEREVLLKLIASLTLCDHMGDVSNDVSKALELIGMPWPEDVEWEDLGDWLGRQGITTLYGTSLVDEEVRDE